MSSRLRNLLLVAMFLTWPAIAQANVGEDLSQLRERYGSAKKFGDQMLFHVKVADHQVVGMPATSKPEEGYSLSVYFDGPHSAMEIFTRNGNDADIPRQDIDQILEAESDGMSWDQIQSRSGRPTWLRKDKKLIARFSPNQSGKADDASVLVIMLNSK